MENSNAGAENPTGRFIDEVHARSKELLEQLEQHRKVVSDLNTRLTGSFVEELQEKEKVDIADKPRTSIQGINQNLESCSSTLNIIYREMEQIQTIV